MASFMVASPLEVRHITPMREILQKAAKLAEEDPEGFVIECEKLAEKARQVKNMRINHRTLRASLVRLIARAVKS